MGHVTHGVTAGIFGRSPFALELLCFVFDDLTEPRCLCTVLPKKLIFLRASLPSASSTPQEARYSIHAHAPFVLRGFLLAVIVFHVVINGHCEMHSCGPLKGEAYKPCGIRVNFFSSRSMQHL